MTRPTNAKRLENYRKSNKVFKKSTQIERIINLISSIHKKNVSIHCVANIDFYVASGFRARITFLQLKDIKNEDCNKCYMRHDQFFKTESDLIWFLECAVASFLE